MQPDITFKAWGIIAILLEVAAIATILYKWRGTKAMSISRHAASHPIAYALFAGTLTLGGSIFYVFVTRWLAPSLQLNWFFSAVFLLTVGCLLLTAWVPDSQGWKHTTHVWAAFTMAGLIGVLCLCIALAPATTMLARVVAGLTCAYMATGACLYLFVRQVRRHFLVYQAWFVGSFYLTILAATYIR